MGRLLTPHDFGLVAAGLPVLVLLGTIRDLGIGAALIQRKDLATAHVRAGFVISLIATALIAAGLVAAAPLISRFYAEPELIEIVYVLAVVFGLRGLSTVSISLLQRDLGFRAIAIVDLSSYLAGSATAVACAVGGLGAWSLILGYTVEAALAVTCYLWLRPPPWGRGIDLRAARDLIGYAGGQIVTQVASVASTQGDNVVVGNALGSEALGLYSRAYDLVRFPANVFTSIVGTVLFPALSKLQGNRTALGNALIRMVFGNATLLLPATAILVVLAPEVIEVLLGQGWDHVVLPFRILVLSMMGRSSYKSGAIVARAAGDVYLVGLVIVGYGAFVVIGAIATSSLGITAVASSTSAVIMVAYVALTWVGLRRTDRGWAAFFTAHVPGLAIGALVLAVTWPAAIAMRGFSTHALLVLLVAGAAGMAVSVLCVLIGVRRDHADFVWLGENIPGLRKRTPMS